VQLVIITSFIASRANRSSTASLQTSITESDRFKYPLWQYQQKLMELTQAKSPPATKDAENGPKTPENATGACKFLGDDCFVNEISGRLYILT